MLIDHPQFDLDENGAIVGAFNPDGTRIEPGGAGDSPGGAVRLPDGRWKFPNFANPPQGLPVKWDTDIGGYVVSDQDYAPYAKNLKIWEDQKQKEGLKPDLMYYAPMIAAAVVGAGYGLAGLGSAGAAGAVDAGLTAGSSTLGPLSFGAGTFNPALLGGLETGSVGFGSGALGLAGGSVGAGFGAALTGESLAGMLEGLDVPAEGAAQNVVNDAVGPTPEQPTYDFSNPAQEATATYDGQPTPPSTPSSPWDTLKSGIDNIKTPPKGLIDSILDKANENKGLVTAGATLASGLISGLAAPGLAKTTAEAQAKAKADAETAIANANRSATSFNGVKYNVTPTGKLLRTGIIGSRV